MVFLWYMVFIKISGIASNSFFKLSTTPWCCDYSTFLGFKKWFFYGIWFNYIIMYLIVVYIKWLYVSQSTI